MATQSQWQFPAADTTAAMSSDATGSAGGSGPPQLIPQLDLGPELAHFVASTLPLPPSPLALPAHPILPIPEPILLDDDVFQGDASAPSEATPALFPVDDSADCEPADDPSTIPRVTRPHAHVRAAMDQAGLAALDALERHVSLTAGDLTLLKRLNVVAKDQVFHSLVHMQDAVAQWNHARSLEDLLHSRLAALDVLVSRVDRLLARATLLERVVNEAARDVATAGGEGVTVDDVLKASSSKEEKRRSRFAIPSWFTTSGASGSAGATASGSGAVAGGGDSVGGGGVREEAGMQDHVGQGGGGGRLRQM